MTIQYILELAGTFFFSLSGALASKPREQDWFGATFIGFLYAILAGIVVASLLYAVLIKLRRTFLLFDTLGIAFFTILGTESRDEPGYAGAG